MKEEHHGSFNVVQVGTRSPSASCTVLVYSAKRYAVSRFVRERTGGFFTIEDAALYQALHRLEARGWVEAEWGLSENNRRAKFYCLTAEGRRRLRAEVAQWKQYAAAVFKVLEPVRGEN